MAAANTGAANKETGTKLVELRVFKEDKSPVTRMDQWKIQFSMSNCILTATRQGVDPKTLWHRGTMLTTHHVVVYTNDQSSGFYKEEIGKITGLQAYLPEEWPRANSAPYTVLYREQRSASSRRLGLTSQPVHSEGLRRTRSVYRGNHGNQLDLTQTSRYTLKSTTQRSSG